MTALPRSLVPLTLVGASALAPVAAVATPQHGLCMTANATATGVYLEQQGSDNRLPIMERINQELAARGATPACRWRPVEGGLVRSSSGECARWLR